MNQYIITEEELSNMIFGEIKGRCADRLRQFTADKIRSRPYNPREGMVWMTSEEEETRIRQAERDKVLDKLCKICPFLDERPETCENCVVETVRKELRQAGEP